MTQPGPSMHNATRERIPGAIWLIAAGIFAMVTSEFMAAGLLPRIAEDVGVSVGAASLLISGFAAGQVTGPWLLGLPLSRIGPERVLPMLLVVFALVQTVGVVSPWPVFLALRVVSGLTMAAYFSVSLGTVARLVPGRAQPRAMSTVFAGVTIGTTLGLPLATFAGQALAWRWAFHLDTVLVLVAAAAIATVMPAVAAAEPARIAELLRPLGDGRLWLVFAAAGLSIGGTLVAFSFFSTILEVETGFSTALVPWLLALYGAASVAGNWLVGRLTHTGATRVVVVGLLVLLGGLVGFALGTGSAPVAVLSLVAIGVSGVSLNSAHTARAVTIGGASPAILTMLPTVVTGGILFGTGLGGVVADTLGLVAPLWVGAGLVVVALATVLPDLFPGRRPAPVAVPDRVAVGTWGDMA